MAKKKTTTRRKNTESSMDALPVEMVFIDGLKDHPRNYRQHPQDQIDHLKSSIEQHGFFKNLVIAKDNTILAGHGAKKAAKQLGYKEVPCVRLPLKPNDPAALKVLAADNEIEHLAEQDDRLLSEILKEIDESDCLFGTGYDEENMIGLLENQLSIGSIEEIEEIEEHLFKGGIVNILLRVKSESFSSANELLESFREVDGITIDIAATGSNDPTKTK